MFSTQKSAKLQIMLICPTRIHILAFPEKSVCTSNLIVRILLSRLSRLSLLRLLSPSNLLNLFILLILLPLLVLLTLLPIDSVDSFDVQDK